MQLKPPAVNLQQLLVFTLHCVHAKCDACNALPVVACLAQNKHVLSLVELTSPELRLVNLLMFSA